MTALNPSTDIPSQINSLEQLVVWSISALAHTNPDLIVVEGPEIHSPAAQAGVFYIPTSKKYRFLARASIEVSADHLAGSQKPWKFAQNLSENPLSSAFKSN